MFSIPHRMLTPHASLKSSIHISEAYNEVTTYNHECDHVPSEFVSLFITNHGGIAPLNIYYELRDQYHAGDYKLVDV